MANATGNKKSAENVPSVKRGLKDGYKRATFIVRDELAYKLNCIASYEDKFLNEIVDEALDSFISAWEKEYHKIIRKKKLGNPILYD